MESFMVLTYQKKLFLATSVSPPCDNPLNIDACEKYAMKQVHESGLSSQANVSGIGMSEPTSRSLERDTLGHFLPNLTTVFCGRVEEATKTMVCQTQ
jgi:hypothetical protein